MIWDAGADRQVTSGWRWGGR